MSKPGKSIKPPAQKPPTPSNPTRQRYQFAVAEGNKRIKKPC